MAVAPAESSYPVTFEVEYPQELSRWLIFVKWILAIPHLIILYLLNIGVGLVTFIAFFIILFTGRYPRELFDFVVSANRWGANTTAYIYLLRDDYPPFSWEPGVYPVTFDVQYPEELSRWLIFVKWLLAIPHIIVLMLFSIGLWVALVVGWFVILFTGKMPDSLFNFIVGVMRYNYRVTAYIYLMRDEYPPFGI